jgi:hypothetical protein
LDLAGVLADVGGLALLQHAHLLHVLIGEIAVDAGARAARPIGNDDSGEPLVLAAETFGDAVVRHDFDVVLVRGDAQVRGPGDGSFWRGAVGYEEVRGGFMELH